MGVPQERPTTLNQTPYTHLSTKRAMSKSQSLLSTCAINLALSALMFGDHVCVVMSSTRSLDEVWVVCTCRQNANWPSQGFIYKDTCQVEMINYIQSIILRQTISSSVCQIKATTSSPMTTINIAKLG